jgi:Flp pilus assembly protein TadG/plastocyanin
MTLRPIASLRRHVSTRSRGQSLVELALILPVFMLFFAAILDLGRIAAAQVAVANAAREGAFQAARTPTDFTSASGCPAGGSTNVIFCRIKLESSGGVAISPSDVAVSCSPADCSTGIGNTVSVVVNGHFRLLTPLMSVFFGGVQNVTISASSTHNIETLPVSGAGGAGPSPSASPSASPSGSASPSPSPSVVICERPSAGFTFTQSPSNKKAPQTVTFTDTSTSRLGCAIDSWAWQSTDGWVSDQQIPGSHTYIVPGTYEVTLTVHNAAGFASTGAVQIQVR